MEEDGGRRGSRDTEVLEEEEENEVEVEKEEEEEEEQEEEEERALLYFTLSLFYFALHATNVMNA